MRAQFRRTTIHAALVLGLLAGPLALPSAAADPVTTTGCVDSVPEPGSTTPVKICYSLFKPDGASAAATVPLIIHSHGWGGSRTTSAAAFKPYLDAGFGVLSFDQRSFGQSTGVAHVMNPDFEGQDVIKLVDLIAGLDWVTKQRPGDPLIGAIGGSYGGGFQFAGAFTELRDRGRTRFDALAPEITWNDLKTSLAPDETARVMWMTLLFAGGGSHLPPAVSSAWLTILATGHWPSGQVGRELDAFFAKNGPAWHVQQDRKLDIPVLLGQGLSDNLFNLNEGVANFEQALTPRARKKSLFVGYNAGHTLPSVVPPGYATPGDPCSIALGSANFAGLAHRFFSLNLKNQQTGLTGFGKYHLSTVDGRCVTQSTLVRNQRYGVQKVVSTTPAGLPINVPVAKGPITVAGIPRLSARVSTLMPDAGAFFALSVGTTPLDAKVIQNNTLPLREKTPVRKAYRTLDLPGIAVDVPAGKTLYLTVSPVADMYAGQGGRVPGLVKLDHLSVSVHRVR
ncbi:peptidase S15 [Kribbella sp. NBC_01245]|uniref:alpha/beta hydrolase n=1 Tax=Kribbella sp. NBC_01245 TaxID=2903578 RepID=UPI002E2DD5F2|nr:CocE/NonD family hydrolase [Kribbella sp. NBC_01245]